MTGAFAPSVQGLPMDEAVTRSFAWLLLAIVAILAAAAAVDRPFAIHAAIFAVAALLAAGFAMARAGEVAEPVIRKANMTTK
jgi:cytochrome c oxidase cbb3-type subunit 1